MEVSVDSLAAIVSDGGVVGVSVLFALAAWKFITRLDGRVDHLFNKIFEMVEANQGASQKTAAVLSSMAELLREIRQRQDR